MSEQTPECCEELDETVTGFVPVQRLKISQLWCLRKRTFVKDTVKAVSKIACGMSVQGAADFTVNINIKS